MTNYEKNKNVLRACLQGRIAVKIYDEEGNLKRKVYADNLVTTNGINRLTDMLIDGYNQNYPQASIDPFNNLLPSATLKDQLDFNGGLDGEIFGLNFIQWPGRYKSTFNALGFTNNSYFTNREMMFDNNPQTYSKWYGDFQENTQYTPSNGSVYGCIADLGLTNNNYDDGLYENFSAAVIDTYYPVANKNLHYGSMVVKNAAKDTTYTSGVHYTWDTGDGDTYGTIKINSGYPALVGVPLKLQYTWHDVPQVPICGFAIKCGGNTDWPYRTFFSAFRWSLNQGQTLTDSFFPFVNGNPTKAGMEARGAYQWDQCWYPTWLSIGEARTYFFNSMPWAVKNPTQISFHGNWYGAQKWIYDFQLLGMKLPKLGCHAIGLGDGSGSMSPARTDLFNRRIKIMTDKKTRQDSSTTHIIGYLDYAEGNGISFTEAGLFYPTSDTAYFDIDTYYSGSSVEGKYGSHYPNIKGTNKILKLQSLNTDDCDGLMTHATFGAPWSKTSAERAELVYELAVNWS